MLNSITSVTKRFFPMSSASEKAKKGTKTIEFKRDNDDDDDDPTATTLWTTILPIFGSSRPAMA